MADEMPPASLVVGQKTTPLLPLEVLQKVPSAEHGIDSAVVDEYRLWGCDLLQQATVMLRLPQRCCATAQVLLHRFFYHSSIAKVDVGLLAMACLFLSSKVEECPRRLRSIITVHYHQYRLRQGLPGRSIVVGGRLYVHWKNTIVQYEGALLRQCGFLLHPLQQHPVALLPPLAAILTAGVGEDPDALRESLMASATALLNDAGRLDLCVRYLPETIAVAALAIAAAEVELILPQSPPWHMLLHTRKEHLACIHGELLGLLSAEMPRWLPPPSARAAPGSSCPTASADLAAHSALLDKDGDARAAELARLRAAAAGAPDPGAFQTGGVKRPVGTATAQGGAAAPAKKGRWD